MKNPKRGTLKNKRPKAPSKTGKVTSRPAKRRTKGLTGRGY